MTMNDWHPDDETISALLDGEADQADRNHLDDCAACQARIAEFRAVSAAVAATPPVDVTQREAAIARAVMSSTMGASPSRPTARSRAARRWTWHPPRLATAAAAAAVFVAAVVAVPLIDEGGDNGDQVALTTEQPAGRAAALEDLGTLDDEASLSQAVRDRLGLAGGGAPAAGLAAPAEEREAASDAAAETGPKDAAPGEEAPSAAPEPPAVQPTGGTDPDERRRVKACTDLVAGRQGGATLVYAARVVWRGVRAFAFAYRSNDPPQTNVFVMAQADCQILVFQRFSA